MRDIVVFLILGLGPGALIAGLGVAVLLQYRGSGTVDLGVGAVAMMSAYIFLGLRTAGQLFIPIPFVPKIGVGTAWPIVPALLTAICVAGLFGFVLSRLVFNRLRAAPPIAKLVATLGVLIVVQSMIVLRFGNNGQVAPGILSMRSVRVFGTGVPMDRFLLTVIVIACTTALTAVYKYTRFGLVTRAAAENEKAAVLSGLSPERVATANTVTAYIIAGALGVLAAPTASLDPTTLALAVVPALGASLIAGFRSLPLVALGGIFMGVIQSEVIYVQSLNWFPTPGGYPITGVADVIFFVIVAVALYTRGDTLPTRGALVRQKLPPAPTPRRLMRPTLILVGLCVLMLMTIPYDYRQALTISIIGFILCLSFVVITGYVGQVSLIQTALAGTAGFILYHLARDAGIGFPEAIAVAVVGAAVLGSAMAMAAMRLRGVHFGILTLAAAVAIERFGFDSGYWGQSGNIPAVPPPRVLGVNLSSTASFPGWDGKIPSPVFGFFCLGFAALLGLMVASLRRSLVGKQMLAVRSNERAAAAVAISVRNVKLTAFALSAAIAGVAGVLYAYNFGSVSADNFGIVIALNFLATAYIGGISSVAGAIVGGMFVVHSLPGYAFLKVTGLPLEYQEMVGGLSLMIVILFVPQGMALGHAAGRAPHNYVLKLATWLIRRAYRSLVARELPSDVESKELSTTAQSIRGEEGPVG